MSRARADPTINTEMKLMQGKLVTVVEHKHIPSKETHDMHKNVKYS
jgi:hypothetical protein